MEEPSHQELDDEIKETTIMQANVMAVIYFVIIFFTSAYILYVYTAKNNEFWYLFLVFILWSFAGMLSIWYAWVNGKQGFAVFFFVVFIGLYWIGIYNRMHMPVILLSK